MKISKLALIALLGGALMAFGMMPAKLAVVAPAVMAPAALAGRQVWRMASTASSAL